MFKVSRVRCSKAATLGNSAHIQFRMGSYFLLICFYVLLLIKSGFMRFANHWILVSSIFYTATQPFQNWVVFGSMEPFSAVVILGFMTLFRAKYKT